MPLKLGLYIMFSSIEQLANLIAGAILDGLKQTA
jgi:hypothetical protein